MDSDMEPLIDLNTIMSVRKDATFVSVNSGDSIFQSFMGVTKNNSITKATTKEFYKYYENKDKEKLKNVGTILTKRGVLAVCEVISLDAVTENQCKDIKIKPSLLREEKANLEGYNYRRYENGEEYIIYDPRLHFHVFWARVVGYMRDNKD